MFGNLWVLGPFEFLQAAPKSADKAKITLTTQFDLVGITERMNEAYSTYSTISTNGRTINCSGFLMKILNFLFLSGWRTVSSNKARLNNLKCIRRTPLRFLDFVQGLLHFLQQSWHSVQRCYGDLFLAIFENLLFCGVYTLYDIGANSSIFSRGPDVSSVLCS